MKDNSIGAFLAGCAFASGLVFLVIIYNNISKQEFCNIFYADNLEFKHIAYNTINAKTGILKFSEDGQHRVISVDSGYSILCYKDK